MVLICLSLMISDAEHHFMYLLATCMPSLEKMSIQVLSYFLIQLDFFMFSCMNALCILDINPLLDISFANSYSHLVGCLFVLLIVSFTVQCFLV